MAATLKLHGMDEASGAELFHDLGEIGRGKGKASFAPSELAASRAISLLT